MPGLLRGYFPEALEHGQRLQGQTFLQFQPSKLAHTQVLSDAGHRPLPAASLNDPDAVLTVRDYHDGPPVMIPRHLWQFARPNQGGTPVPDASFIYSKAGFEPGKVYELVYTTVGAPVAGLGLLAMRDCTSWLRYAGSAAGNPLAGDVESAYGFGVSLSGRFIREFLYQGMNEDEARRQVFDGLLTVVGSSRRGEFNFRFAQPSTNIARAPGNQFPFSYAEESDPVTGRSGSLLARTRVQGKMPKLVAVNSGMEYWWSGASLQHIDVSGTRDLEIPDDVRTYYFCGTQHAGGSLPLTDRTPDGFRTIQPMNTVNYAPMLRAALLNLDRWVREGVAPPDSAVPSVSAGTAVRRESLEPTFRSIPGAGFPAHLPRRPRMDYGPRSADGVMSYPPIEGADYIVLTSSLNADLNEVGGVQPLDLRVPLATYTGWNLRHADVGQAGEYVSSPLPGSTLPFAMSRSAREQNGDPRLSIEERYQGKDDYLARIHATAAEMVGEGHLLAEDLPLLEREAAERWDAFVAG